MTSQNVVHGDVEQAYQAARRTLELVRTIMDAGSFVDTLTPGTKWVPAADELRQGIAHAEGAIQGALRAVRAATRGQEFVSLGGRSAVTAHELVLAMAKLALGRLEIARAASERRKYEKILSQSQDGQPADIVQSLEEMKLQPRCQGNVALISENAELQQHDGSATAADHEAVVNIMRSIGAPCLAEWNALEARLECECIDTLESLGMPTTVNDQGASTSKGVSLQDAASCVRPNDPDGKTKLVKAWRDSRTPKLPPPIGKDPGHAQRNLYEPTEILKFLKQIEGDRVDEDFQLSPYFGKVSRYPRS